MTAHNPIRWGILSTASIARRAFLPALRAAGGGVAYAVGGRDLERARQFAVENEVERAYEGYERVLQDDQVDAVYIALPNSLHAEWTIAALEAGKAVLCEKPLAGTLVDTERVLAVAHDRAGLLWEAFVFPFREQIIQLEEMLHRGEIGDVREIQSSWTFPLRGGPNIRLSGELQGGALRDIGCYAIRLARLVFSGDAEAALAHAIWNDDGVDLEMSGVVLFPQERRLVFSCGMRRRQDTFTRIIGTEGELRLTNPYHPRPDDTLQIVSPDGVITEVETDNAQPTFTEAIQHIHRVLWGEETPRHTATAEALGNAVALDLIERSAHSGCLTRV